ncbi:kinase-like domain-containing protein [Rhizophagus irregularis DAOM 181602=DAOM 197198]|nr:kinase-like domain-containing protein [Rhizophagus irregularis DAOM 181602=DAOM 197198]
MSSNAELTITKNSNEHNWIEEAISKKLIKYYEFDQFCNIQKIGSGGFGKVYRASWKNYYKNYALKSFFNFDDATVKAIVHEIQLQREVDFHDNVISFYGITATTSSKENQRKKYMLVMEYADNVSCLHNEGIMHRDLHSNNVSTTTLYVLNNKSDVYSIGVLLWEISSGQPPFHDIPYDVGLALSILQGLRETPIPNTSIDYIKIYTDCWNIEPDNRSTINQVVDELKAIMTKENIIIKDFHLYDNNKDTQLLNDKQPILDVAELGDSSGICDLAYCYQNGIGTDIDNKKAFELYQHAAGLEDSPGIYCNLGYCYYHGSGTDIDEKKAFELFQKAADLGDSLAQYALAKMYENGEGIDKNVNKAIHWYEKSAEQGNQYAQNKLKMLNRE